MPSIINSDDGVVSGTSGLKTTGGNDGITTFQQNGTERMRITTTGELLVGGTTSVNSDRPAITLQGSNATIFGFFRNDTTISSGNAFGQIIFYGNDTTSNTPTGHAAIVAAASGTHAAGDNPTDIYFATTPSGSAIQTEQARITAAGNLQFNSGYGSVATAYGCRAWVNFNGTGTVAIRASGNVTSITDNGVGDYTVNFTTAMPDANYCFQLSQSDAVNGSTYVFPSQFTTSPTTSALRVGNIGSGASSAKGDPSIYCVAIFR